MLICQHHKREALADLIYNVHLCRQDQIDTSNPLLCYQMSKLISEILE
jgi:hypothetical protein